MQLRAYQEEMVEKAVGCLSQGKNFLCVVPTGGGKTVIAAEVIRRISCDRPIRTLFLAHMRMLVDQARQSIGMAESVDYSTIQGFRKGSGSYDLIVIDEAHHSIAESYQAVLRAHSGVVLGLTATPERDGLGGIFPDYHIVDIFDLMRDGHLAKVEAYVLTGMGKLELKTAGLDFSAKELGKQVNTPTRNRIVAWQYKQKADGLLAIAFCVDIQHCKDLALAFREVGVSAIAVSGEMSDSELAYVKGSFKAGIYKVLCSCSLLCEGVDIPEAQVAINVDPTKSVIRFKQKIGRVLRKHPSKDKAIVLDFVFDGHSLASAVSVGCLPIPIKRVERVCEEEDKEDKPKEVRVRRLDPIAYVNESYNILESLDDPWLFPFSETIAIVPCKSVQDGINSWVYRALVLRMPSTDEDFVVEGLEWHKGRCAMRKFRITCRSLKKCFAMASAEGFDHRHDRRWAIRAVDSPTPETLCAKMGKFRMTPTGKYLQDATAFYLKTTKVVA